MSAGLGIAFASTPSQLNGGKDDAVQNVIVAPCSDLHASFRNEDPMTGMTLIYRVPDFVLAHEVAEVLQRGGPPFGKRSIVGDVSV